MAEELSYVLVTPYSIRKSRTGGIIARLISRTGLDLVAARMFAPSAELVEKYAARHRHRSGPAASRDAGADQEVRPEELQRRRAGTQPRVLLLVFKGEDAVAKIQRRPSGTSSMSAPAARRSATPTAITSPMRRATVTYFEPAVLAPPDAASARSAICSSGPTYSDTRWRPARRRDRVSRRHERREDARAHQAGQLPLSRTRVPAA